MKNRFNLIYLNPNPRFLQKEKKILSRQDKFIPFHVLHLITMIMYIFQQMSWREVYIAKTLLEIYVSVQLTMNLVTDSQL